MNFLTATKEELLAEYEDLKAKYEAYKSRGLSLNMARGKPCPEQLDASMGMLDVISSSTDFMGDIDYRNYGGISGIREIKEIIGGITGASTDEIVVYGNSSLALMYDTILQFMQFGVNGGRPWCECKARKWLCPVPGYDRHFAITETFGFELIPVPMDDNGPDMDKVEELIKDENVKGIWCVPKYSNPTGIVYSDEVISRFARLKPTADDFIIMWDDAYVVHDMYERINQPSLLAEAKKCGTSAHVRVFGSFSKINFPGAGSAYMLGDKNTIDLTVKTLSKKTIGPDKLSQYMQALFYKDAQGVYEKMKAHAEIMRPKFQKALEVLSRELGDTGLAKWSNPKGGYFISLDLYSGTAKRAVELAKEAGVIFTSAGATYPYGIDPNDSNIRIAPSYPSVDELEVAMEVLCCSAKLAYIELKTR